MGNVLALTARATVAKFQAETPLLSPRYGTVKIIPNTGGAFPVVLVKLDGPDTGLTPVECACAVPGVGERVLCVFPPPNGAVCLFPSSGGSGGGGG